MPGIKKRKKELKTIIPIKRNQQNFKETKRNVLNVRKWVNGNVN